jgi:hypothetical protein
VGGGGDGGRGGDREGACQEAATVVRSGVFMLQTLDFGRSRVFRTSTGPEGRPSGC